MSHQQSTKKRFFNPIPAIMDSSPSTVNGPKRVESEASPKEVNIEVDIQPTPNPIDLLNLPSDPGLRPNIMSYPPNLIEQVHRDYLLKGPCQPRNHDFPQKMEPNIKRTILNASVRVIRLCLMQGLAFRGA